MYADLLQKKSNRSEDKKLHDNNLDVTSLARRFEIPRSSLNSIKNARTEMERLAGLEDLLTKMGISQQLLNDQAESTAVTYDKLGGSFDDLKASVGQLLATLGGSSAATATTFFNNLAESVDYLTKSLKTLGSVPTNQRVIKDSESYQEYTQRIKDAIIEQNRLSRTSGVGSGIALKSQIDQIKIVTEEQFNFIKSLKATADEEESIIKVFVQHKDALAEIDAGIQQYSSNLKLTEESTNLLRTALYELVLLHEDGAAGALASVDALNNQKFANQSLAITYQDIITLVDQLNKSRNNEQKETGKTISVIEELKQKIKEESSEKAKSKVESDLLSNAQQQLMIYAQMAADGLISAADAASTMANKFGFAQQESQDLINSLRLLQQEQLKTDALETYKDLTPEQRKAVDLLTKPRLFGFAPGITQDFVGVVNAVKEYGDQLQRIKDFEWQSTFDTANEVKQLDLLVEKQKSLVKGSEEYLEVQAQIDDTRRNLERYKSEFEFDVKFEVADTPEKITLLEGKLKGLTEGTKEYYDVQLEIVKLRQQLASEGAGGGAAGLSAAEGDLKKRLKIAQDLRDNLLKINEDFYKKSKEAEQEYYDNLKEIFDKYNKEVAKAQRENEKLKRESRADFYKSLTDVEGIDTQAFSAQYEAAFAEAQRIAQEGKASLSREFLSLRQDQISEMMDLEREMADIRADEDMPETSKKAKLEYLQGVKKLIEDAQQEELKQLMEGGDSNLAQLNEELSAEEKRYQEQTQKIALEAKEQADEKVKAAQRATDALSIENKELQKQLDLLGDITEIVTTNAGKTAINSMVELPTRTAPIPVPQPVIDQAQGTAVPTPDIIQSHDRVLNETLSIVGIRLEERLLQVINAINTSKTELISSIGTMDKSIQQLRGTSLTSR